MYLEYCRLAYRFFVPRKERSVAGEITAITGAGSGKFAYLISEKDECSKEL
jgi:hypothetical protein